MSADAEYTRLRLEGWRGWGGANYSRRFRGWVDAMSNLSAESDFPRPPARTLELGCGNGTVCVVMARMGYDVHGVDNSIEAIEWAQQRFAEEGLKGSFSHDCACEMSTITDHSFDLVVDGNCLHCLIGSERVRCLKAVRRVLRRGGTFVVSSMCGMPRSADAYAQFDPGWQCLNRNGRPYRTLKPANDLLLEVTDAGFTICRSSISAGENWDHAIVVATSS